MSWALRAIAFTWSALVAVLTLAFWIMVYRRSASFWAFWRQMQTLLVPWNGIEALRYYVVMFSLVSPALLLFVAADRLDRGQTTKRRALLYAMASVCLAVVVVYSMHYSFRESALFDDCSWPWPAC